MNTGRVSQLLEESRWLTALARRLVGDPSLADDLAQETLLAAIKAQRQPAPDAIRGWLATILRRRLIGQKREETRRDHRQNVAARNEALPSASEISMLLESERLLRDALEGLGESYRRVVSLRYREGLSAAEIARRDGEPAGTVRSRLRTALGMLRDRLEERDHAWALTLVPFAALPTGAPGAVKAAGASSTAAYVLATAAAAVVAVPLTWNAMQPAKNPDAPAISDVDAALDPAQNRIVATAEPTTAIERVQLEVEAPSASTAPAAKAEIVPGVIELTVLDGRGQPIRGAYAQRWDDDHRDLYSSESGADGRLQIAPPKQRQSTQEEDVLIRPPGWAAAREEMTFEAGRKIAHDDVTLEPAAPIHGTVHDPHGADQQWLAAFVAPLPEKLMTDLTNGASLREVKSELKDLDFIGAFETTRADTGEFMLNDVAVGTRGQVIALGDDDGGRIGWSKVVELKSGVTLELDPIMLLPPASKEATSTQGVEVTIALPEGAAEADFTVSASYSEGINRQMMKVERRSPTEFFIPCSARQEFSVSVHADDGGYLPMSRHGVSLKSGPVVLEIAAVAATEVEVLDEHGRPLESFELQLFEHTYHGTLGTEPESSVTGSAGVASFTPPSFPWRLRIVAGDGLADLSPFDEGTYNGPRTIQLEASTTYTGRAERNGGPWANAIISLRERCPTGLHFRQGEILSRAKPGAALAEVTTGADGSFSFPAVKVGEYVVAAQPPDTPAAILEVGLEPEFLLTAPSTGTISGSVQAKFGELAPGIVTVSQEFGLQRSVRFESDGAFRFENLPEGLWRLGQTYWSYGDAWLAEPDESARMSGGHGPVDGA